MLQSIILIVWTLKNELFIKNKRQLGNYIQSQFLESLSVCSPSLIVLP